MDGMEDDITYDLTVTLTFKTGRGKNVVCNRSIVSSVNVS
jgi:hypothetical protein